MSARPDWIDQCHLGDCLEVMRDFADNSVDSIVTDPPYGLSFMGKKWDYDVPSEAIWVECLRVLKPGGYLLAFAGTRTQHRMTCRIEDAGFEIRDMIAWVYGSGFPKSHNGEWGGTALKPALEPITMARKPLIGTVAANWAAHGTGALNIDACRVGSESTLRDKAAGANQFPHEDDAWEPKAVTVGSDVGRWPANLIHDGSDEVLALFPQTSSGGYPPEGGKRSQVATFGAPNARGEQKFTSSSGSASRFFYCAKANRADRNDGCGHMASKPLNWSSGTQNPGSLQAKGTDRSSPNNHPTVKPTALMRYLCRLVTPTGGVVLDPFMGSGSTGRAALLEGMQFVGIEREAAYVDIAKARIESTRREGKP